MDDRSIWLISVAGGLLFTATIIMFITFQHQQEKEYEYLRMKNDNARLSIEKSYYEILDNQNQKLMMYAHDAKNHLAAMRSLNDDPRMERYISELSQQLSDYSRNCHSGNKLLDVMLGKYDFECERRGIHLEYDVKRCNLRSMDDIDLVAVLGNLMDNAVAAAAQSREKTISLVTAIHNSYGTMMKRLLHSPSPSWLGKPCLYHNGSPGNKKSAPFGTDADIKKEMTLGSSDYHLKDPRVISHSRWVLSLVNLSFFGLSDYLVHWTHSFCCLNSSAEASIFQDGMLYNNYV